MNTTTMKSTEIMSGSTTQKKIEKKIELKINKKLSNNMNAQTIKKITTYLKYKADMKTFKYEQDFVVDADATITGVEKMTLMYDKAPEKPTDEELEEYYKTKQKAIERLEKMEAEMKKEQELEEFRMNNVAVPEKIIKVGYVCFGCKEVPKAGDSYGLIIIENDNGYFDRTEVVKRTKSFVWVKNEAGHINKKKVNIDRNGDEYIADEHTQPVEGWRGKLYTYFTEEGKWW